MTAAGAAAGFAEAQALHEAGRLAEAERLYLAILAADSRHAGARLNLGILRLQQGRHEEAVALTRKVVEEAPDCAEAHSNLGAALHLASRHAEAEAAFEAALAIDPDRAEAYYGLSLALHAQERFEEAAACGERALAIDPDYAEASCALGAACAALDEPDRAIPHYRRALEVDPDYAEAVCGLGEALAALKRYDEAAAIYRRAAALRPDHSVTLCACGHALQRAGRHSEALDQYRRAVALAPGDGDAQQGLGVVLEEMGRIDDAHRAFETAFAIDPHNLRYAFSLVSSKPIRKEDAVLAALQAAAERPDSLKENDRILLHFALGKALSDIGRHDESFRHLLGGNALKRRQIAYDERATLATLERLQQVFGGDWLRARPPAAVARPPAEAIFIVGMPRSGSTLIEQMLASHSEVFGGGERTDFAAAMAAAGIDPASPDFPQSAAGLDAARLAEIGSEYLARLDAAAKAAGRGDARRITDKLPANLCFVGLAHKALPGARFIFTLRDPVDTCLSCFSKLFAADQPFAYELGELGRYHRACERLAAHWRRVIPPGVILNVRYEEVVADFEGQARRILAHCGLDWDPACLSFYETERVVRTASLGEVRRPVYRSSVGRWRPEAAILSPLLDALAGGPPPGAAGTADCPRYQTRRCGSRSTNAGWAPPPLDRRG